MPLPKPVHQPQFTEEQLGLARKVSRQRSAPLRRLQRARLTLALAEHQDWSHEAIAALCDLDRDTVYKWRRRWAETGPEGWSLEDAPRSGRPPGFSPQRGHHGSGSGM